MPLLLMRVLVAFVGCVQFPADAWAVLGELSSPQVLSESVVILER